MMKTIRIACPKCGVRLGVTREMQGRTLRCAGCKQHLRFGKPAALKANPPQASLSRSSQDAVPQATSKQQSQGSKRAAKHSPATPPTAPVAASFVAAPKNPAAEPLDLTVPRLSAFSGRVWGGFALALLLLGGAVAGSLCFAP
jgi:hypothetical protein